LADSPDATSLKRRARRRLVGAIALVLFVVIVLPIVLDQERQPAPLDLTVQIPSQEAGRFNTRVLPPLAAPPATGEKSEPAASAKAAPEKKAETAKTESAPAQAPQQPEIKAKDVAKEPPPTPAKAAVAKAQPAPQASPAAAKAAQPAPQASPAVSETYIVPLGVFVKAENVKRVRDRAAKAGIKSYTEKMQGAKGEETRVRAGPFASREAAEKAREKLKSLGMNVGQVAPR